LSIDANSLDAMLVRMTTPEQVDIYRRMTPAERVRTGCALHDFAFNRLCLFFRRRHPEKSSHEIEILATKRILGESAAVL